MLLNCGVGEDYWWWSWNSNTLTTSSKELTHWKRPWCWEKLGAGGEGDDRTWDGWMASPTRCTWETPGVGDGQGGLVCCDSWGHKQSDMTERLNWTECVLHLSYSVLQLSVSRSSFSLLKFSPCSSILFPSSVSILNIALNSLSDK